MPARHTRGLEKPVGTAKALELLLGGCELEGACLWTVCVTTTVATFYAHHVSWYVLLSPVRTQDPRRTGFALAYTVCTELGITSIKVLPAISVVVYVVAPAPRPAFVWPLLLAPGPGTA